MNLKKIFSSVKRNWASATSAALLASSSIVFASSLPAEAFTLIKNDDGAVYNILDLEVNGEFFDVEFLEGSYNNIYNGSFDFNTVNTALAAAEAVAGALASSSPVRHTISWWEGDMFWIPYDIMSVSLGFVPDFDVVDVVGDFDGRLNFEGVSHREQNAWADGSQLGPVVWAKFRPVERTGGGQSQSPNRA